MSVAQEEMWGRDDHRWSGREDRPPVVERAGNGDGDGQPGKLVWAIHVSHTGTNVEDNSNVRSLFEPSTFLFIV